MSFHDLWVEVVALSHVEMGHNVVYLLGLKHALCKSNLVEVLVVLFVLEVVDNCHLGWAVLQQDLHWHARHQTA